MKTTKDQQATRDLDDRLLDSEGALQELRGMMFLAAGYVRSQSTLGYTPDVEELDYVALTLERFGERLSENLGDLLLDAARALPRRQPA